ncbi:MAG TPA: LysE family translocator [Macromonas sp.]|nr:LysE family translocator [Macromonas sp.]
MSELLAFSGIVAAITVGAISPGPSFLMVARTAVAQGRSAGLLTALGMGLGAVLFAWVTLLGVGALLHAVPWLYQGFKLVGGVYLLWLGWRLWRGANEPLPLGVNATATPQRHGRRQLALGFATQVSNPKTAVVYAGIFAAFVPQATSLVFDVAVLLSVGVIEAGWYAVVATLLSAQRSRQAYLRYKPWLDRVAGTVLGGLGVKLALAAA